MMRRSHHYESETSKPQALPQLRQDGIMELRPSKGSRLRQMVHATGSVVEIKLGARLTPETAEIDLGYSITENLPAIRIDLSQCKRIDVVALLYIVAVTARRAARGQVTRYNLPTDLQAQDYIRRRGFAQAIEWVADVPFRLLVDGNWFHEPGPTSPRAPIVDTESAILAYLDRRNFFCFSHYGVNDHEDRVPIIERERRKWQDPLVLELLKASLVDSEVYDVARVVVREMLANLLSAADRGDVMCVSDIEEAAGPGQSTQRYLTIAAWHGRRSELSNRLALFDQLLSTLDQPGWREVFMIMYQNPVPERKHAWPRTALARWTREIRSPGEHDKVAPGRPEPTMHQDSLEALYKHVVDAFDGKIDLWSGANFAALAKSDNDDVPYQVSVRYDPNASDAGSMIAVRLPLRHE